MKLHPSLLISLVLSFLVMSPQITCAAAPSPLFVAVGKKDLTEVTRLLDSGISPDMRDNTGETPLMLASRLCLPEVMQTLIQHEATVDTFNKGGITALIYASFCQDSRPIKIMLEAKADVGYFAPEIGSALSGAIARCNAESIELLLQHGADVNIPSGDRRMPLMDATRCEDTSIFYSLVKNGGNIDVIDKDKETLLMQAVRYAKPEIIVYLLDKGADVKAKNAEGYTVFNLLLMDDKGREKLLMEHGVYWRMNDMRYQPESFAKK